MTTSLHLETDNLYSLSAFTCACGSSHRSPDHCQFLESMPQDPLELVDDLIKMGHYPDTTLDLAKQFTHQGIQKALLLQMIDQAEPAQRDLCNDLIQQAGGLEAAFAAAFGPNATEFFGDAVRMSRFRRRDFLTQVAAAAAVVMLGSCAQGTPEQTESSPTAAASPSNLEKKDLTIGFIPIACSIPIVAAEPLGIYQKHGLNVTLKKMSNWAAMREAAIAGELDAYHMLSPMPISISLGLGSSAFPIKLASIENTNGQSITVAMKHKGKIKTAADFKGMSIAVPFPYSMHNLLLRYYLASGGLDPDKDVNIQIVPPPDSVAKMGAGQIDAFLMPDNFGQRAVFEKVGFIHLLTKELWDGHPCCAFAASQPWIDKHPNTFRAVNKAIIESAAYSNTSNNRPEIAKLMSDRKYLNQPEPVLQAVLTGKFENGLGETLDVPNRIQFDPYPWKSFAAWIASQMNRWDLLPEGKADYDAIANQIYMTDLARDLAQELGQNPPTESTRIEKLKDGDFDPAKAEAYVQEQIKQYGV